jgi:hypothetical protein
VCSKTKLNFSLRSLPLGHPKSSHSISLTPQHHLTHSSPFPRKKFPSHSIEKNILSFSHRNTGRNGPAAISFLFYKNEERFFLFFFLHASKNLSLLSEAC